jgi:hypothetical protein
MGHARIPAATMHDVTSEPSLGTYCHHAPRTSTPTAQPPPGTAQLALALQHRGKGLRNDGTAVPEYVVRGECK